MSCLSLQTQIQANRLQIGPGSIQYSIYGKYESLLRHFFCLIAIQKFLSLSNRLKFKKLFTSSCCKYLNANQINVAIFLKAVSRHGAVIIGFARRDIKSCRADRFAIVA